MSNHSNGLSNILKHDKDHLKTALRLAFERGLYATNGEKTKLSGRVYRSLQSSIGIAYTRGR